jgi:hypothetical protein
LLTAILGLLYGQRQAATVSLAGGRHHLAEHGTGRRVIRGDHTCAFSTVGCFPAAVTITASVVAGRAPITTGSVTFCCAAAIVGRAQLNGGTAKLKFIPAIGVHAYKAILNATATAAGSTSAAQTLTVTGLYPTTKAIAATGNPSGYDPTATVVGFANPRPLLSFTKGTTIFEVGTIPCILPDQPSQCFRKETTEQTGGVDSFVCAPDQCGCRTWKQGL